MKPVTKTQMAHRKGVSVSAVAKSCRVGVLRDALVGDRVDLDHPAAQRYLKKSKRGPTPTRPAQSVFDDQPASTARLPLRQLAAIRKMTLGELLAAHGTEQGFRDWLLVAKLLEEIQEKQLKTDEGLGKVVSRELVERHVLALIDAIHRDLTVHAPARMATAIAEAVAREVSHEEIETRVRQMIGAYLAPIKDVAVQRLHQEVAN